MQDGLTAVMGHSNNFAGVFLPEKLNIAIFSSKTLHNNNRKKNKFSLFLNVGKFNNGWGMRSNLLFLIVKTSG